MIYRLIIMLVILTLSSCATISHRLELAANETDSGYPPGDPINPMLDRSPTIDLSHYKSVQTRPMQRSDIAIAFAASGGGYRAANLTLGVMLGLEKVRSPNLHSNLLQEIDYFSSVSGGGFAVGYYLASLHNYLLDNGTIAGYSLEKTVSNMLKEDFYATNPLRRDYTEQLFFGRDRGILLEEKFNSSILNTPEGGLRLGDMFISNNAVASVMLPYWVTNTTIYQNATVLPITPDLMSRYRVVGYTHNQHYHEIWGSFLQPTYAYEMPASIGMTASGTMPFAIPATTLTTKGCLRGKCYLQLLDGGLIDNLGVYTALNLLAQDQSKIKILIIADAYKGNMQPYSLFPYPPEGVALLGRVLTVGVDSNRERVKSNIQSVARDLLCNKGVENVIVIYLDLQKYPEAQKIGTQLSMTSQHQKLMIHIGKNLVATNQTLRQLIHELNNNYLTLGQCQRKAI